MSLRWTAAQIATLRADVKAGYSAGRIADRMGKTKNQVVGKGWRLGLTFKAKHTNNRGGKPSGLSAGGPLTVDEICRIMEAA